MNPNKVSVTVGETGVVPVRIGGGDFTLIAGPCQIESLEHSMAMASAIKEIADHFHVQFIFKSSFDKANRSKASSTRGTGIMEGLSILATIRHDLGIPVTTDVHDVSQIEATASQVDMLQIPAFLSRQTDLILAAGYTQLPVNIKKGQFMSPGDAMNSLSKIQHTGNPNGMVTERGTFFGYRDLVVDYRNLDLLSQYGQPVVFDATHSVQSPGGKGDASGGDRARIPGLARAAVASGVDAIFMEVHDQPSIAPSDGDVMLSLTQLEKLLPQLVDIHNCVHEHNML